MHKSKFFISRFLVILAMTGLVVACSGKTKVESDLRIKGAPDWVNEGSQALNDKKGRLIHGVGSAPDMGDFSLQNSTADERARAEIARVLSSYMDVVSNEYLASSGASGSQLNQQSVSRQIQNLTQVNLAGSKIIGRWKDKRTGTVYSIAELDMKHVQSTVQSAGQMNAGLKSHFMNRGDNIFDQFSSSSQAN